jgi:HPt (histidine-containing phosphotransfer) domain-containing protein
MGMAYDPGAIDATLAATVGDDPALIVELRLAFISSTEKALAQMDKAEDVDSWRTGAARLRGLAASFGAVRLMALAAEAVNGRPGDQQMLAKLRRAVARL